MAVPPNLPTNHQPLTTIASADFNDLALAANDVATNGAKPKGAAGGDLAGTYPNPTVAAAALIEKIGLTDLTGVIVTTPASSQELIYDGAKWINVLHKRRAAGYVGITGDGATNDSTAIATAINEINVAGRGWFEFQNGHTYRAANIPFFTDTHIDLNDAIIKLPDSAATDSDAFRSNNFDSLIGGGTTGGVYHYTIENGRIDGNVWGIGTTNYRHGIAAYGIGTLRNLMIHDVRGSFIHAEWSGTGTPLEAAGLADGDHTNRFHDIECYNAFGRVFVSGYDVTIPGGITGVTNATNPTITTAKRHLLRVGQPITIAGVVGAVGVNGAQVVLATPSDVTFTVTAAAPGAYSSGGTITFAPRAGILLKGGDSPFISNFLVYQDAAGYIPGMRGVLIGTGGTLGQGIHIFQNFPCALDVAGNSNSSIIQGCYVGGGEQGILMRQNDLTINGEIIGPSSANSVGLDYQVLGGCSFVGPFKVVGLSSGSYCVRMAQTSSCRLSVMCKGDGGVNTSTLYDVVPNGTTQRGFIDNLGSGVNASPASFSAP